MMESNGDYCDLQQPLKENLVHHSHSVHENFIEATCLEYPNLKGA
jgi:hypothetical protein